MRGGGTQLVALVVLAWLFLASSAASEDDAVHAPAALKAEYIKLNFSTASSTPDKYKSFIASVRAALVSKSGGNSSGIPVLISEDDPLALEAFVLVNLVNKAGHSVTLKMDLASASFVAYVAGNHSCLLKRSGRTFSSAICFLSSASSSSSSSAAAAAVPAVKLPPRSGLQRPDYSTIDLDEAVSSLLLFPTGNATKEALSTAVATCDMMVATAAAFPYVERRISAGMSDGNGVSGGDTSLLALQALWPSLSAAVQGSRQGAFAAPVAVQRSNGDWLQVDNVRRAVALVSFLEYQKSCSSSDDDYEEQQLPLLIRPVVQDGEPLLVHGGAAVAAAAECGEAEPTVRLVGPEGRCVDVPYGYYYSGNQVQLWSCKSNGGAAVNQLWTLKKDGTIRSNGKWCLTSAGDAAGARVVINDCPSGVPTSRVVWEVRADGTVALKGSGGGGKLVLAVTSSSLFAPLTVQADDGGTGQSWTPTNDTAPMDAAIVGFRDLCLQVDSDWAVSVGACGLGGGGGGNGVKWAIYPDGSIRPPAWLLFQWQCLAADASGRVRVKYCDGAGSACERWVFRNDGTIFNTGTGMVLDVVRTAAGAAASKVIVSSANGSPTQQWTLML